MEVNAQALGRYAALCQEQGLVPIVEPEVLMDGNYTAVRCEEVTGAVLDRVFRALYIQRVALEGMLLKPNMVVAGEDCREQSAVEEVATATLRCLRRHVPPAVPGIVFLSGGQTEGVATEHLNVQKTVLDAGRWRFNCSYGRARQAPARGARGGKASGISLGQQAVYHRARCKSAASLGSYKVSMETEEDGLETRAEPTSRDHAFGGLTSIS